MKKTIISILLTMTGSAVFAEGNSTPQIPPGMEIQYNVGLSQGKICSVQHELIAKLIRARPLEHNDSGHGNGNLRPSAA